MNFLISNLTPLGVSVMILAGGGGGDGGGGGEGFLVGVGGLMIRTVLVLGSNGSASIRVDSESNVWVVRLIGLRSRGTPAALDCSSCRRSLDSLYFSSDSDSESDSGTRYVPNADVVAFGVCVLR